MLEEYPIFGFLLPQVACEGLLSLDEVTGGIPEERWPEITKLSIDDGRFLTLTLDDLLDLPSLHTLVFNYRSA